MDAKYFVGNPVQEKNRHPDTPPGICFTAENNPWMQRKIIWTKSLLFCSMLIARGVVSLIQNSDSYSGWFPIFHPNMKAHYPVKDRRKNPHQCGPKDTCFFWLNMTLTMRSMACHLHPPKRPRERKLSLVATFDENPAFHHHPLFMRI